jgi:hypothetical protein
MYSFQNGPDIETISNAPKSKLAQHVYREGHKIQWNEAKVLQMEPDHIQEIQGIHSRVSVNPAWTSLQS